MNIEKYDTLVLSGGGINGIILLGSLQYVEEYLSLKYINKYIGSSVGTICCYLLAIGYSPIEIIVNICTKQMLEHIEKQMKTINIINMINGEGATSFDYINEQLEKMTIEKIGKLLTINELKNNYNKELYCVTYNITLDKQEIISYETYPDMQCLIGLRMSNNLPFIFDKFNYLDNFYIDGGVSNNFAIDIGEQKGNKVIGITLYDDKSINFSNKSNYGKSNKKNSIVEFC